MTKEEALAILLKLQFSGEVKEALETLIPEYSDKVEDIMIKQKIIDFLYHSPANKNDIQAITLWLKDK